MTYKLRIGIVDDEKHGRDYLALLLANEFPDIKIAFIGSSMEDALNHLNQTQIDILLLDIELGDGSAFDLLKKTKNKEAQLIFVTAYEHYALKAIKNDAIDFVLKPIEIEDFITAINKAIRNIQKNQAFSKEAISKINLPTRNGFKSVAIDEIIRCEADSNYTWVYLTDKTKTVISKTLQDFEQQFSEYNFYRVHYKHLINLDYFSEYIKGPGGGQALMTDGSLINISTRRKSDFLDAVKNRN
ncbi:MAG: LytTR family DNA-binding domain-containing protein [Bacteroidota bacterium]